LALAALAEAVTAHSESVNANWPFFQVPSFVSYAHNAIKLSGAEMVWFFTSVSYELREEYVHWMNDLYYNRVAETNMYVYGDLTRMPDNNTYIPDITWITDEGFVPDIERDLYFAASDVVPPPYSFGYVPKDMIFRFLRSYCSHKNHSAVFGTGTSLVLSSTKILCALLYSCATKVSGQM
jgi:hypothetical protein